MSIKSCGIEHFPVKRANSDFNLLVHNVTWFGMQKRTFRRKLPPPFSG